ncbi:MAG: HD-GYP domain-containing protein [bacterium]|nr:HD-GYP domain-containing protein [bacterium]
MNLGRVEFHEFIESLTEILEMKDVYTKGHSNRVAEYASMIAKAMGFCEERVYAIHMAGHLHDIGKVGVCDQVLKKNGRLTCEEYEEIKRHSVLGYNILVKAEGFKEMAIAVRHHHERWDGKGYPDGLIGENIPLGSRILGIADAFDAMTTERPYRRALTLVEAIEELKRCSGSQFDPKLVEVMISIIQEDFLS